MAQFDAYDNPTVAQRGAFPYLVTLQSDQLDQFPTRFMMPLMRVVAAAPKALPRRLSLTVEVNGERLFLAAHLCATLPSRALKRPVASLRAQAASFVDALDAVVSGV